MPNSNNANGERILPTSTPFIDGDAISRLYQLAQTADPSIARELDSIATSLKDEIESINSKNSELANAQASALANSAMIMSELKSTQTALENARTSAESASKAKSEFLANMSHEIRTPINGVLGMNEILLRSELTENQRRCANTIRNSVEALLQIINDILDFSKIEAGKFELSYHSFNFRDLLEDVMQLFAENAQRKGLELNVIAPASIETQYLGDAVRLRQILTNLVGNAIKFTSEGEIVVRLRADTRIRESIYEIELSVQDSGIGIEQEALERIFESFSQADSSTERRFGGTGLGLSISKQLVQLMDGEISVESEPGAGSIFHVKVPLERDLEFNSSKDSDYLGLQGLKILAVDDNETNRHIYADQLNYWQCDYSLASSGKQGLTLLAEACSRDQPFDMIILDMHMPEMDGLTFAAEIQRNPNYKNLLRVMLSSIGDQVSQIADPSINIHKYMTKPVRYRELYDCLLELRGGNRAPNNLPLQHSPRTYSGHVLIAEDNIVNQEVAHDLLELNGVSSDIVGDGQQAIEMFIKNKYDMILMDCQMPKIDGFSATRAIREKEQKDGAIRTPIIALTAFALDGDREKCIAAGMDDYLKKPFTDDDLTSLLSKYLDRKNCSNVQFDTVTEPNRDDQNNLPVFSRSCLAHFEKRENSGKQGILKRIVGGYLEQSDEYISALKHGAADDNFEQISSAAHALKSGSAVVGALALSDLCQRIEQLARSNAHQEALGLIDHAINSHQQVCDQLRETYRNYLELSV